MDNRSEATQPGPPQSPVNRMMVKRPSLKKITPKPLRVRTLSISAIQLDDSYEQLVPSEVTKADESARVAVSRKIASKRTITLTPTSQSKVGPIAERLGIASILKPKEISVQNVQFSPSRNSGTSAQSRVPSKTVAHIIGPRLQTDRLKTVTLAEDLGNSVKSPKISTFKPTITGLLKKETTTTGGLVKKQTLRFDHKADTEIVSEHEFEVVEGNQTFKRKLVTFANGAVFEGEMQDGMLHGKGYFRHPSGYCIRGHFEDNKIKGSAEYSWGATTYSGQWLNNVPHGKGKETVFGVYTYEGDFYQGVKFGRGKWIIEGKGWYDGEVRFNRFNGRGTFCWKNGKMYVGLWKEGLRHGRGKMSWPDGRVYEGMYVNNKKEGVGQFTWADGRQYTGPWKVGQQQGTGKYLSLFGQKCEAKWGAGELLLDMPSPTLSPTKGKLKD
jgi:hypothetical protein